ncbi:MAG: hypothetical protein HRT69_17270, partial [Flavobacteriaceae bacterium]|nr:hypothetical protein [Flavobacteriaceae bacterium]
IDSMKKDKKGKIEKYYLTEEFEFTLKNAKYYAKTYLDNEVNVEHIILSTIADKKSLAGKYLNEIGMDYSTFKTECKKNRKMTSRPIMEFIGRHRVLVSLGIQKLTE